MGDVEAVVRNSAGTKRYGLLLANQSFQLTSIGKYDGSPLLGSHIQRQYTQQSVDPHRSARANTEETARTTL